MKIVIVPICPVPVRARRVARLLQWLSGEFSQAEVLLHQSGFAKARRCTAATHGTSRMPSKVCLVSRSLHRLADANNAVIESFASGYLHLVRLRRHAQ